MATYVTGFRKVQQNINKEVNKMKGRTAVGMTEAFKHLEKKMNSVAPMTPMDTKALRKSFVIGKAPKLLTFGKIEIVAGYTVPYAPYVHEMIDPPKTWKLKGAGPKWLQIHFYRDYGAMTSIIAKHAKIKK